MKKILEILTPENVYVEYELAGFGSRFVAVLVDSLAQMILSIASIIIIITGYDWNRVASDIADGKYPGAKSPILVAVGIISYFLIQFAYFIVCEMTMNGQTIGKKIMKLRAVKENGEPLSFIDSVIRNVLRFYKIPLFGILLNIIDILMMILTRNYKRVGDFAANTVIVRVKKAENVLKLEDIIKKTQECEFEEQIANIYPVNNYEYGILKEFLARKNGLGTRRPVFAFHLNKYFMKKFNIETPYTNPYEFFEEIVKMNSGI